MYVSLFQSGTYANAVEWTQAVRACLEAHPAAEVHFSCTKTDRSMSREVLIIDRYLDESAA